MRFTVEGGMRRVAVIAAIAVTLLSATGCTYTNLQATTTEYAAGDGVNGNVGPLKLTNMLVVGTGADEPGRITGAVFNSSDEEVELSIIGADGGEASVMIPANGDYYIDNDAPPMIIEPAGADPGAMTFLTVETSGASEELNVPVLDGTFERYATMVPTPPAS